MEEKEMCQVTRRVDEVHPNATPPDTYRQHRCGLPIGHAGRHVCRYCGKDMFV